MVALTQENVPKKIFYDCRVQPEKLHEYAGHTRKIGTTITDAYFGRRPDSDDSSQKLGIGFHVTVSGYSRAFATVTYTRQTDIEQIMDFLGACRIEELVGKTVTAHLYQQSVVALSVPQKNSPLESRL